MRTPTQLIAYLLRLGGDVETGLTEETLDLYVKWTPIAEDAEAGEVLFFYFLFRRRIDGSYLPVTTVLHSTAEEAV